MTLLDAKQYDFARARRRRNTIIIAAIVSVVLLRVVRLSLIAITPSVNAVQNFFAALQNTELRSGLWDLVARSGLEATSAEISEISI